MFFIKIFCRIVLSFRFVNLKIFYAFADKIGSKNID